jgi:hypothetical protein
MEEYKVAVTTKLRGGQVAERLVTVRGETVEEAEALYHQMLDALPAWGPNGASDNGASENGQRCPQHGKARQGEHGLYCPSKMPDGSWCKWRG